MSPVLAFFPSQNMLQQALHIKCGIQVFSWFVILQLKQCSYRSLISSYHPPILLYIIFTIYSKIDPSSYYNHFLWFQGYSFQKYEFCGIYCFVVFCDPYLIKKSARSGSWADSGWVHRPVGDSPYTSSGLSIRAFWHWWGQCQLIVRQTTASSLDSNVPCRAACLRWLCYCGEPKCESFYTSPWETVVIASSVYHSSKYTCSLAPSWNCGQK